MQSKLGNNDEKLFEIGDSSTKTLPNKTKIYITLQYEVTLIIISCLLLVLIGFLMLQFPVNHACIIWLY